MILTNEHLKGKIISLARGTYINVPRKVRTSKCIYFGINQCTFLKRVI
jgi:hypothetical protein